MLALSALLNYIDRLAVGSVSPLIVRDFHLDHRQWGEVGAMFFLVYVFCSWLGGKWIDRVGVRKGLLWSTAVWSLSAAGHALSTGFVSLCAWRGLLAVGEGPGGASLLKGVRRIMPPALRDTGTGIVAAGNLLGGLLTPLLVIPLAGAMGWRAAFVVTAALSLLWLPLWIVLARRPGANLEAQPAIADETVGAAHQRLEIRSVGVWATLLAIFFTLPPTVFTLAFLPLYLHESFGIPTEQLKGLLWQPYLAMDIGQLSGGACVYLLLRRGWRLLAARRAVMALGFLGATGMLAMLAAPSLTWAMVFLNVSRFLFQFAYAALLAYGIDIVMEKQAGAMNGVMNAAFGACNFVFNLVIGDLAERWGYRPVLLLVGVLPAVGLACWMVLSWVHDQRIQTTTPSPAA
jgi:ACS family hexuronate transporter-like MFS transporter